MLIFIPTTKTNKNIMKNLIQSIDQFITETNEACENRAIQSREVATLLRNIEKSRLALQEAHNTTNVINRLCMEVENIEVDVDQEVHTEMYVDGQLESVTYYPAYKEGIVQEIMIDQDVYEIEFDYNENVANRFRLIDIRKNGDNMEITPLNWLRIDDSINQ